MTRREAFDPRIFKKDSSNTWKNGGVSFEGLKRSEELRKGPEGPKTAKVRGLGSTIYNDEVNAVLEASAAVQDQPLTIILPLGWGFATARTVTDSKNAADAKMEAVLVIYGGSGDENGLCDESRRLLPAFQLRRQSECTILLHHAGAVYKAAQGVH